MARHTAPTRRTTGTLRLEAAGERDESDPHRHKWVTRLRFGLLSAEGPNTRGAVEYLEAELRALASCPEAIEALARVRALAIVAREATEKPAPKMQVFEREQAVEILAFTGRGDEWILGEYDAPEGNEHSVWLPQHQGWKLVPDNCIRAVNRPSLADVG